jgi:hypothetical protein
VAAVPLPLPSLYFCNDLRRYNASDAVIHVWSTPQDATAQHVQRELCEDLWDTVPY